VQPGLPAELADRSQLFEYKGKVGDFERLVGIVEEALAGVPEADRPRDRRMTPVEVKIRFVWVGAERRMPAITGQARARLTMLCQRCLEVFEMPVVADLRMLLIQPGQDPADVLAGDDFELWELETPTVRPVDIVEEALIMAMPLAPKHELVDDCGQLAQKIAQDRGMMQDREKATRPFAGLKLQMEKSNK